MLIKSATQLMNMLIELIYKIGTRLRRSANGRCQMVYLPHCQKSRERLRARLRSQHEDSMYEGSLGDIPKLFNWAERRNWWRENTFRVRIIWNCENPQNAFYHHQTASNNTPMRSGISFDRFSTDLNTENQMFSARMVRIPLLGRIPLQGSIRY